MGGRRDAVPDPELLAVPFGTAARARSAQWAAEFNEVKALGRADGATRNDQQTYIAKWWQSAPVFSWNEVARQLITRTDLDAADSARLLALQNMSGADAAITCWNDKYHFDFWRPWNAVPRAGEDNNPATVADPSWTALITAPYPEWTSGHNCLDAANTTVLRMFFGDDPAGGPFQITSFFVNPGGPAVRTFDTFTQPLTELIEARIWAGLHYRSGTWPASCSAATWPTTAQRTTSSPSATDPSPSTIRRDQKARRARAFSTAEACPTRYRLDPSYECRRAVVAAASTRPFASRIGDLQRAWVCTWIGHMDQLIGMRPVPNCV